MNSVLKSKISFKHLRKLVQPAACSSIPIPNLHHKSGGTNQNPSYKFIFGASLAGFTLYEVYDKFKNGPAKVKDEESREISAGSVRQDLPYYTLEDVAEHSSKETRIWITYKEGVYDITDFISGHPGGDQILLAAGSSVEPFWVLYAVHNNPHVLDILETLRIGNLSKEDSKKLVEGMEDPYSSDPRRHAVLKPASAKPFNAETPLSILCEHFITPNELFYVRNHLPVPQVEADSYELEIEIEGSTRKSLVLNLNELKKLPKHTITATVMCAGNRRSEMTKVKPVKGLNWGAAAVGNATWTGVRLRDVLKLAGLNEDDENYKHVQVRESDNSSTPNSSTGQLADKTTTRLFTGTFMNGVDFDPTGKMYGASIPIWKAMDRRGDVILAYEMNGVPIPRDHGFPIRVIVPGVVGARNVKWLGRIVVSKNESDSHWQQNDYKGFSPSTDWDTADFTKSPAIQELPVISAICKPSLDEIVKVEDDGTVLVKGYAWSGGGQKIVRVDVTIDGGKTWHVASVDSQGLEEPPQHWSWTLWSCRVPVKVKAGTKNIEIWVKAVDSCYNTQPESFENIWNLRGVLSNAYHRVPIKLKP